MDNIIKMLRGKLTRGELSRLSGIPVETIAGYEKGRFPKPEAINKIAAAVGKRVRWIIEDADGENKGVVIEDAELTGLIAQTVQAVRDKYNV